MNIRIGDVKGALPKKIEMDFYSESTQPYNQTCVNVGYNSAINEISNRCFTLNREKFAERLYNRYEKFKGGKIYRECNEITKNIWRLESDATLSNLPDLVEYVQEGEK